ncbi:MAG: T9SS type A sorting domain-containing protein [Carboxylicivirga sp.]|nr:T9SS type A sorting domain-containing protein [Carboxylicivirga sp.]
MKFSTLLILVLLSYVPLSAQTFQITPELMDYPINDITFPATHNSFNASNDGYSLPNTHWTIQEQLEHGIRCFEIDVHYQRYGFLYLKKRRKIFHSQYTNGTLGITSCDLQFSRLRQFLENNPNEIIFLKIEKTISQDDLVAEFSENGLLPYFYQGDGVHVPTVRELIESNKRICATNGVGHDLGWGFVYEGTPTGQQRPSQIQTHDAMYEAPSPKLFWTCNTYLEDDLHGAGSENDAAYCNNYDWLLNYVEKCWKLNGQKTWRLIVDFPSIGNMVGVANTINSYKMIRGTVLNNDQVMDHVDWECIYSDGDTINTATYGRFNFPLKPGATVKLKPRSDSYQFSPAIIELSDNTFNGESIVINAIPVPGAQLKSLSLEAQDKELEKEPDQKVKIYPIPVTDDLNIDLPIGLEAPVVISLVDMQGRTVQQFGTFDIQQSPITLNASDIKSGAYLLKIESEEFNHISKVLIK